jgi:hypothetical protein
VELGELEEISHQVATNDLRAMVRAGSISQRGAKRGTYYVASDPLVDVRERAKADRQSIDASSLFDTPDWPSDLG